MLADFFISIFLGVQCTDHVRHTYPHPIPPVPRTTPPPLSRYHIPARKFYLNLRFRRLSDTTGDTPK